MTPIRAASHDIVSANSAGKSARYATSAPAARIATGRLRPPYVRMTPLVQYTVPAK